MRGAIRSGCKLNFLVDTHLSLLTAPLLHFQSACEIIVERTQRFSLIDLCCSFPVRLKLFCEYSNNEDNVCWSNIFWKTGLFSEEDRSIVGNKEKIEDDMVLS